MNIGPMLEALPELLPLPWKNGVAEVSRAQARRLLHSLAPGAGFPRPGWEVCLVVEESGSWRSSVWLVNQADPRNLEFILGLGVAKSPCYLRLDWRSIVRFT